MEKKVKLVPFGKYKGQPIEVMQLDEQYCDWLSQQSWFREKYQSVYNQVIVNNFTEPTETPEHNKLQMKFLNNDFCFRFCCRADKFRSGQALSDKEHVIEVNEKYIKSHSEDQSEKSLIESLTKTNEWLQNGFLAEYEECKAEDIRFYRHFEEDGWDVILRFFKPYLIMRLANERSDWRKYCLSDDIRVGRENDWYEVFLEIKPCMGDDFPAVLRQIKANARRLDRPDAIVCVIDEFAAEGATFEQVKEMFASEGISLVTFAEKEEEKNC